VQCDREKTGEEGDLAALGGPRPEEPETQRTAAV